MANSSTSGNKTIAKNTLYMYFRMFITMLVGLYTSRVVLRILGVDDFGIYNVVGGLVVLFSFINSGMAAGTQRHLSYELGKKDGNIKLIYSASYHIHIGVACVVLVFAETLGLWFLNTQMNFPENRMQVINWVYQISVVNCIVNTLRVPDNAAILAYERMSFYAYMGILEALLKLAIVFLLYIIPHDKLVVYSVLILVVSLIINLFFLFFCHNKLSDIKFAWVNDRTTYKYLLGFSMWALFGSVANVFLQQGINIIANIFFGVAMNAAIGIANQVNSHVFALTNGFQQAFAPQLTKVQASHDRLRQSELICLSAKFSYFITLVIVCPMVLNMDYILYLWLGQYPDHTSEVSKIMLYGVLIETLSGPLWITIFATGKIQAYQFVISVLLLMNIPISYVGGLLGMTVETMYLIRNIIYVAALLVRLGFMKKMIDFDIKRFVSQTLLPIFAVTVIISALYLIVPHGFLDCKSFVRFTLLGIAEVSLVSLVILFLGLNVKERQFFKNLVVSKLISSKR